MTVSRLPQLDVIRALCIIGVLGRHLNPCPPEISNALYNFTLYWNNGGWVGVDVFFVLSGFLVSGLLFREYQKTGDLSVKRFLIRRGLKIYPAFYLMILATVIINPLIGIAVPLKPLLAEIFFVQNLIFGKLWTHTWSLAVEEHFYIGLAILAFALFKRKKFKDNPFERIPQIFIFIAVVCLILRFVMGIYKGTNISPTPFRIDSLFFGVLLSYLWHFRALGENQFINRYKNWFVVIGAATLAPMFAFFSVTDSTVFVVGLTTNYLAAGLLLIGFLKSDFGENFLAKTLAYIGTYSYSIYLWHLPIQEWLAIKFLNSLGINDWFAYAAVYLFGAIIFGILLSKIIEYPILHLRDKFFPSTVSAVQNS